MDSLLRHVISERSVQEESFFSPRNVSRQNIKRTCLGGLGEISPGKIRNSDRNGQVTGFLVPVSGFR